MRLTDVLTDIGRPVAYYPGLRKLTGSTSATVFLCQFIYWTGKQADPEGWIYKTAADITEETGLSKKEQQAARRNLVRLGLIQEKNRRTIHQMNYRVCMDEINEQWEQVTKGHFGKLPKVTSTKLPLGTSLIGNTESTKDYPTGKGDSFKDKSEARESINREGLQDSRETLRSAVAAALVVDPTGPEWEKFLDRAAAHAKEGQDLARFLAFIKPDYNPQMMPPRKLIEIWPRAFVQTEAERLQSQPDKWDGVFTPAPTRP